MTMRFKTGLLAAMMTAVMAVNAHAASPRTESTVTADVITLGDIFDGVIENAAYVLAPAPEPGKAKTLNASDLSRVSTAFNLGWKPENGFEQVVIRRVANEIGRDAIEAALQEKLASLLNGRRFDMDVTGAAKIHLSPEYPATVEADDVTYDLAKGEFRAVLSAPSSANPVVKQEVRGRLAALTRIPVLSADLRSGDVISEADITFIDAPAKDVTSAVIVSKDRLVGMTPRRGVAAGKAITTADLQMPTVVKKGDAVTMTLRSGTLQLTAQGKALESGAAGERVRIVNIASNQVVDAIVTGPQSADVVPPTVTLASSM